MNSWFLILGCQRSGTTLMRLILESHSRIECADEGTSYGILAGRRVAERRRPLLGLKVPCVTEQLGDATLQDPFALPKVANPYQGQPLIFLVRDARDTIASMRALRTHGRPWIDDYLRPTLLAKRERDTAFVARYASALADLETAGHLDLAQAAFYWRYKVDALYDCLSRGFPTLLMRYEDLVTRPRVELLRVCGFLRMPWEPGLLAHAKRPHGETDANGFAIGGTQSRRPINSLSVDRWRRTFRSEEVAEILRFAGERQAELYPPVKEPRTT